MTRGASSGHLGPTGLDPGSITDRAELATALTAVRESAGLSVRDLARQIDSPVATVGGYLSGRHLPTVAQSAVFGRLLAACGVTDPDAQQRWWEAVSRVRRVAGSRPPSIRPPYLGLESFQLQDAALFFGRERLTEELVAAVRSGGGPAGRMVAVIGPSGSGKSSLVRAGLVPALAELDEAAGAAVITPGDQPTGRLAEALATGPGLLVVDQFEEVFTLVRDELERRRFIGRLCAEAGVGGGTATRAVVIVLRADFYALAISEAALLPVLTGSQVVVGPMTAPEIRRAVIEPARIAGCEVADDLVEVLINDLTPLGAPSGQVDAGALPLLSHALSVTWQRAPRRRLTVADYRATGGIAGAVAQSAEAVLSGLPARQLSVAPRVLLRMVNVDDDAVVTRRRLPLADLPSLAPSGPADAAAVVDRFVAARLMTIDADSVQISHEALLRAWPRLQGWIDESRVSLGAHRRLAEAIRVWQDSDRDPSALLGGARLAAIEEALAVGTVPLTHTETDFLAACADAIAAERAARVRRRRRGRLIVAAMTALAVLASGLAVFAVVSGRAASTEQQAAADYRDLAMAGDLLGAANRIRPLDVNLAAQLTMVAYRTSPTVENRSALLDATAAPLVTRLLGAKGPTMQARSPDGRTLAVADAADGSIRLLSIVDPIHPTVLGIARPAASAQQFSLTFSPDGRTIAAGSSLGVVQRWDVSDLTDPVPLGPPMTRFPSGVFGVLFSPDGGTLLAGGEGGQIARWSLADPTAPVELDPLPATFLVQTMAMTRDGTLLAVGGRAPGVDLWSLTGPQGPLKVATVTAEQSSVSSATFSPDGRWLVVGARDGAVTLWDVTDPSSPAPVAAGLTRLRNLVNVLTFSDDGTLLAAGGSDGTVRAWRTADWTLIGQQGHPAPVTGLAVTADGVRLLSSAADGTTRSWSVTGSTIGPLPDTVFSLGWIENGDGIVAAPGPAANAISLWDVANAQHPTRRSAAVPGPADQRYGGGVAIRPDGRLMATTLTDGRVQLWSIADPDQPAAVGEPLTGPSDIVQQLAFSADGRQLAAGANDESVWLWDVTDPAAPAVEASMPDLGGPAYSVAFGAGDRVLAAALTTGQALVWTIDDPRAPVLRSALVAGESYSFAVAISPDGRQLAVTGADRQVRRWDITDPANPIELGAALTGPGNDVYWVDYSPDGHLLAAASTDRNVWIWDVTDPTAPTPYATLSAAPGLLFAARFDPTGSALAAGGNDRQIHRWSVGVDAAMAAICGSIGTPLTEEEWQTLLPGQPYAPPCS